MRAMSHPASSLPLEDRVAYLRAVAALVCADGGVAAPELDAVRALAEALTVDAAALDVDAFARSPDAGLVEEALTRAEQLYLGHALLTDAAAIALADGAVKPEESAALAHYAQRLGIPVAAAGVVARYVASVRGGADADALSHALVAGIGAADRVQSPGVLRALWDRLTRNARA
jgi:uncharacterized tellurite resistance protein B-like protein